LRSATADAREAYRAYPLPVLGAAAGAGFLLGRLRIGAGLAFVGARLAGGPAAVCCANTSASESPH